MRRNRQKRIKTNVRKLGKVINYENKSAEVKN